MALSRGVFVVFLLGALTPVMTAGAAPVLRGAEVLVEFQSPAACVVTLMVDVEGASQVEHRVEVVAGARVELSEILGAAQIGEARAVGRTRALVVRPEVTATAAAIMANGTAGRATAAYTLRYAVEQPPSSAGRCPLWIPTVPADGRSQAVALRVRIPAGAVAAGTMPGLAWVGREGSATLGHLPAFVRVPYAMPGDPAPFNIAFAMDVVAIGTLVLASAAWARRSRRPPRGLAR
jgi:hypothetical protein